MDSTPLPPPLFVENQRGAQHWWGTTLVGPLLAFGLWYGGIATHHGGADTVALTVVAVLPWLLLWPLLLQTRLEAGGVRFRYPPLKGAWEFIPWAQIRRGCVRTYSPLREYGGWGYKGGFGEGLAYNVWGNQGLQLVLANGDRLLIGTQRPAEIQQILTQLQITGAWATLK